MAERLFTFQLKHRAQADPNVLATSVVDRDERREIISRIHQRIGGKRDPNGWVEGTQLVEAELLVEARARVGSKLNCHVIHSQSVDASIWTEVVS